MAQIKHLWCSNCDTFFDVEIKETKSPQEIEVLDLTNENLACNKCGGRLFKLNGIPNK